MASTAPANRDNAVLNAVLLENENNASGLGLVNDHAAPPPKAKASLSSMAFVLLNTALGAGMLGLPGSYKKAGLVGGTILSVVSSALSILGVHLLLEVSDRVGRPASFYSVAQAAAGAKAGVIIDLLIMINAFGSATSYLIVTGDAMPEVAEALHAPSILQSRNIWMFIMLAVGAPLAFLHDLSALRFTAYVAFVCVLYITIIIGLYAVAPATFDPCGDGGNSSLMDGLATSEWYAESAGAWGNEDAWPVGSWAAGWSGDGWTRDDTRGGSDAASPLDVVAWPPDGTPLGNGTDETCRGAIHSLSNVPDSLDALPIFIFAYTCHQNAISISNELHRPTPGRCLAATIVAIMMALGLYLVVGIGGYLTYGDSVSTDILKMYPDDEVLPLIGRVAMSFVVTTCYPMQMHPGRGSLLSLIAAFCPESCIARLGGAHGTALHIVATSALVAASIGVALAVNSLGLVLTIIGALCSVSIQFILPGGCYVLLFKEHGWTPKRCVALAQLVLGLIVCPLCLVLTFLSIGK